MEKSFKYRLPPEATVRCMLPIMYIRVRLLILSFSALGGVYFTSEPIILPDQYSDVKITQKYVNIKNGVQPKTQKLIRSRYLLNLL